MYVYYIMNALGNAMIQHIDIYLERIYLNISNLQIVVQYHQQQIVAVGCMNFHIEMHRKYLVSMMK